jgi:hypothetical protein
LADFFQGEEMSRKAVQTLAGVLMLSGWGIWGANALPTARLESLINYPNPFDSRQTATVIAYTLKQDSRVSVRLFSLLGQPVRSWEFSAGQAGARAGENRLAWDGTDESGQKVSAGGYVCQLLVEEQSGLVQGVRKIGVIR